MKSEHIIVKAAVTAVRAYQVLLSPILPRSCRFVPTCSDYTLEAFKRYGILRGSLLAVKRILRCHPLGGSGLDQVP